jgi:hypothetical protein
MLKPGYPDLLPHGWGDEVMAGREEPGFTSSSDSSCRPRRAERVAFCEHLRGFRAGTVHLPTRLRQKRQPFLLCLRRPTNVIIAVRKTDPHCRSFAHSQMLAHLSSLSPRLAGVCL